MSQTIKTLIFDNVGFVRLEDGVHPHLKCPVCRRDWTPNLSLGSTFPATFDVNRKVSFVVPTHNNVATGQSCSLSGATVELFVAVHRDINGLKICIQRSDAEGAGGIPATWWQRSTL